MSTRSVPLVAVGLLAIAASSVPAAAEALCGAPDGSFAIVARGAELTFWPGGEAIWSAPKGAGTVWSLACEGSRAAVGLSDEEGRGRIVVLERGSSGWSPTPEIPVRGVPLVTALAGDRLATVVQDRKRTVLGFAGIADSRLDTRELPGSPRALAVSPDGRSFLLAVESQLKTYRSADGGTWLVYDVGGLVTAVASRPGVPRLLVARGRLPVRATASLDSVVLWGAWSDAAGRVAALLLADGPQLVFVAGDDLRVVDRVALPELPAALAALDGGRVLWLDGRGEVRVAEPSAAAMAGLREPEFAPLPAPEFEPEPEAPPPPPPVPPAAAPAEAPPATAPTVAPPATAPTEAPTTAAEAPVPRQEPIPAPKPAPEPVPVPVPEPPPVPVPPASIESTPAAGMIVGVLTGDVALVTEIVVAGPNNITTIAARVNPDRGTFRVAGLRPGTYRVTPMGAKGASLRCAPAFSTVTLGTEQGARVDFEIAGALR